jgi:hypothetical protein
VMAAVRAARPEVIVHQMTALVIVTDLRHFDRKFVLTNRLRTEGTRCLLDAATRTGVRRPVPHGVQGVDQRAGRVTGEDETSPATRILSRGCARAWTLVPNWRRR